MDYDTLIDRETWDFINRTIEFYPPDATGLSVA
ncbi:MAG TPA: esterase, partial [Aliiroseovarius sp.]|nr:esterase [Aliiroseovarius sp.]